MPEHAVLLMSDIVDSTRLIEALADARRAALFAAHDEAVHRLAAANRGRELNRSDGVLMRFQTVDGAAHFAAGYHAALAALHPDLRARVGIHVGRLEVRAVDDLRASSAGWVPGVAIPMTARVMALASGQQTLMTRAAKEALGASQQRCASHGHWRLKGIEDPVEVFEIGDAASAFAPPPDTPKAYRVVQRQGMWHPRREIAHTLPAERDRFIGRNAALRRMAELFEGDARLVTVVGPGGGGKTRLAQRFGWRSLGDFEGGVWHCDLSQATTCDGLVSAVAQGLALQLGASPPIEQIAIAIAGRGECVVILDNFEQLTQFGRETLGRWLDAAARARFIVTSRTVLGLAGETVLRLQAMEPDESARLFNERARAARDMHGEAGLSSDSAAAMPWIGRDAETVDALVRLLDGIPLAIELAAARLRIMDLPTLLARMRERFKVLSSGGQRVGRHATLRATLDWSWELLSPTERSALAQTSVFEGGFDLAAFEAVIDLARHGSDTFAMDVLQSLVEKSWVQQATSGRFMLLGSVQEYAGERLLDAGEVDGGGPALRHAGVTRHGRHYASLDEHTVRAERCIEIDNLVAAVKRAVVRADADCAVRALSNCWIALKQCGPYVVAETLAASVRGMPGIDSSRVAIVELVAGSALQSLGRTAEAKASFQRGMDAARDSGARLVEGELLGAIGEQQTKLGDDATASRTLQEALAVAQSVDNPMLCCTVLNALGTLSQTTGDNGRALERYREALAIAERVGHEPWAGALLGNMGIALYGLGDVEAARDGYERALRVAERFGDLRWIGNMRSNLGLLLAEQGAHDEARTELDEALRIARHLGHLRLECIVLWNLGINAKAEGRVDEALARFRAASGVATTLGDERSRALLDDECERLASGTVATA